MLFPSQIFIHGYSKIFSCINPFNGTTGTGGSGSRTAKIVEREMNNNNNNNNNNKKKKKKKKKA